LEKTGKKKGKKKRKEEKECLNNKAHRKGGKKMKRVAKALLERKDLANERKPGKKEGGRSRRRPGTVQDDDNPNTNERGEASKKRCSTVLNRKTVGGEDGHVPKKGPSGRGGKGGGLRAE